MISKYKVWCFRYEDYPTESRNNANTKPTETADPSIKNRTESMKKQQALENQKEQWENK